MSTRQRSQKTDLEEFYAVTDLSNFEQLREELSSWQFYYNWQRPHGSLAGKTPCQFEAEESLDYPLQAEVCDNYDSTKEHVQHPVYAYELALQKLKRCL